jgi:hypothetical protein
VTPALTQLTPPTFDLLSRNENVRKLERARSVAEERGA